MKELEGKELESDILQGSVVLIKNEKYLGTVMTRGVNRY